MDNAKAKLRSITLAAPFAVLQCQSCGPPLLPNIASVALKYPWSVGLECSSCNRQWYVCKFCCSARTTYTTNKSLYDHNNHFHRIPPTKKNRINNQSDRQDYSVEMSVCNDTCDGLAAPSACSTITGSASPAACARRKKDPLLSLTLALPGPGVIQLRGEYNNNFFRTQHLTGLGHAYLVGQSQFKLPNISAELIEDEVELHHTMAALVATLTIGQQHMLAQCLKSVTVVLTRQCNNDIENNTWATRIPTTPNEIRKIYVEGKHEFLPNLPRPKVTMLKDHAYVSLIDCVADLLAHGFEVDTISRVLPGEAVTEISQWQRAQNILGNAERLYDCKVLTLYLTEWNIFTSSYKAAHFFQHISDCIGHGWPEP